MTKVARVATVSKSSVKKSIAKPKSSSNVDSIPFKTSVSIPQAKSSKSNVRLDQLSAIITTGSVSRGKRKRAMKRATIESRKAFVAAALEARRTSVNVSGFGQALGNFAEMTEAVKEAEELPVKEVTAFDHRKKWQKGALKRGQKMKADSLDITRYQTLMAIPEFANDPIAAIEQHMLNVKRKHAMKQQDNTHMMQT